MSSELKPHLHLAVGHILFLDIVGYSKLLADEQKELIQELNQIVRETKQFQAAEAEGKLMRLPTGDGMVLVFTNNPEAPVECALEISQKLQSRPQLKLRMGIHSGPVNPVADVNDQANLAGAGINIAQRVMACGDAGCMVFFSAASVATVITTKAAPIAATKGRFDFIKNLRPLFEGSAPHVDQ